MALSLSTSAHEALVARRQALLQVAVRRQQLADEQERKRVRRPTAIMRNNDEVARVLAPGSARPVGQRQPRARRSPFHPTHPATRLLTIRTRHT